MPDINLTEQEAQTLLRCLNDRIEPPEELAKKLFPKLYAGFDFKTLNRASIPTIEYAGKRSEAAILNEASAFGGGSPLQIVRFFRGGKLQKEAQQLEWRPRKSSPRKSAFSCGKSVQHMGDDKISKAVLGVLCGLARAIMSRKAAKFAKIKRIPQKDYLGR